jgi:thiol:disulfide interchange protein DsbD
MQPHNYTEIPMKKFLSLIIGLLIPTVGQCYTLTSNQKEITPQETAVEIAVNLNPHELIYEKHVLVSSGSPDVTLSKWKSSLAPQSTYDPITKKTVKAFSENFSIKFNAHKKTEENIDEPQIHVTLSSNQDSVPQEKLFDIHFQSVKNTKNSVNTSPEKEDSPQITTKKTVAETSFIDTLKEYRDTLKNTITQTDSWLLRILLAYILGLLLSLTPCIYPMIPITVGVLQSQGSSSIIRNFFLSLCYTLGLGTTFSLMGLLAASSGAAFGSLMVNPVFVVCIVTFLCYFAFSLFGFYNLYIPRFMQNKGSVSSSGSALSIFVFGLASGSVASPCLSPGLALILTMVATMANKFLGFLLLFAFGFGISTPLLIIGTFSSSMNLLPQAGTWMLEIQKVFGFMLIGMSFYYLSNIMPWNVILMGLTAFTVVIGMYYFNAAMRSKGSAKTIQNIVGILAFVSTAFLAIETFQETYHPAHDTSFESSWYKDYDTAFADAKKQNKMVFIDFWTPYCSICKAITATILKEKRVRKLLETNYIILSVDASDSSLEPYKTLRSKYDTWGAPNLLVVDPNTGKELKRWQSEMYDMEISDVIKELTHYSKSN